MSLSKKEVSILIEIIFSVLFAVIFMPYFYENRLNSFDFNDNPGKIIQIVVFSAIYFAVAYSLLELTYKDKMIQDERDDLISSKSYKLGYLLYELSLFVFIGILASDSSFQNSGPITFIILLILLIVSFTKSIYQLYLYRTS
ncbi:MAG: hypothetical protein HN773_02940 [Flavobacteriaceae bacterium]|jgi:hypothetical protein|nr:hypothetical protein [Flavobacteriaceae bacterium]MBT4112689.1 hypothetical protein [Flavobacteriaceae bacterium]MBT4614542.1 hypothetical protein [Flavobacteriaceae bacterium]MBT5246995.1 hypothetical protein [Flavobacteriaceae bacterium]MBT5650179.1 hypothetical protein [Flavobacteriaceae bacterium]